jgi:hypothetical protein
MKILAIDPGGTTGICVGTVDNNIAKVSARGQIAPDHYVTLWRYIGSYDPDIVVCERFTNRAIKGADLGPCEVIGIVKLWCEQRSRALYWQGSDQMGFWDDTKLKAVGLYLPGQRHASDATSHWLYHVTEQQACKNYLYKLREARV